ncbi:LTA synthase family protein [Clostridium sp. WLY-B-L2]|uniref:LTA synthase family protein n=1 Tax=Clostridium aromativorans TaxID=2836848 RepID=A0ABS8N5S6_9CLOT|nr:LTA synthase family protein [Clostridium aromativorans]MCC9295149.1 LTA synthase family protein [Clostridium aromativorans]CAB1248167.1 Alkaline phosphatase [Clostridiaceae bacterium BL-3]
MRFIHVKNRRMFDGLFNLLANNIDVILFFSIVYVKLISYEKSISSGYMDKSVIFPIAASILILISFSFLFKEKNRTSFLYIVDIVLSAILVADLMYYRYFKDITTVAAIRNAKLLQGVSSSVGSVASAKDLYYFLDLFILLPLGRIYKKRRKNSKPLPKRILSFLIIFALGIGINAGVFYRVSKEQPTLLTAMSNRIYLTNMIGNIDFHLVDSYNYINNAVKNSKDLPEERVKDIKAFLQKNNSSTEESNFKGIGEGKNLIVIQVEALQGFVINQKVNGQEITPNLNKWVNKCMYFDNYYYQVAGGNTSDAELMSNNSLYPAQSGAAYYTYSGNKYDSLAAALKDKNYYTAALHGNSEGFWNRNVMYKAQSFDDFFGEHSFNVDEKIGLGLSDKSFLNQSLEKMKNFKQPYYSFLVTLTSHFPYEAVDKYGDFNVGEYEGTFIGKYLKAIHYTDAQLGKFLDNLEKDGIMQNSIIALYGDHFAIPKDNAQQLFKFENESSSDDYTWFKYQKVPLLLHFPNDEYAGVNHRYTCQMDLYPTLANMYNLPKNYMFGKDMLNGNSQKVIFRNGSFIDGQNLYVSWSNTYYDLKSGTKVNETEKLKKEKDEYTKELQYSDDLQNHNLISEFSQKK